MSKAQAGLLITPPDTAICMPFTRQGGKTRLGSHNHRLRVTVQPDMQDPVTETVHGIIAIGDKASRRSEPALPHRAYACPSAIGLPSRARAAGAPPFPQGVAVRATLPSQPTRSAWMRSGSAIRDAISSALLPLGRGSRGGRRAAKDGSQALLRASEDRNASVPQDNRQPRCCRHSDIGFVFHR